MRDLVSRISVAWIVVAMGLVLGGVELWQNVHYSHVVECQAQINRTFSEITKARGEFAEQDREANRRLLESVVNAHGHEDVKQAMQTYLATERQLDAKRRAHPYPSLPRESCD